MRLINPIIPGEYRYPTITPFTIPDGHTYLKTLERLVECMRKLIDSVNENNDEMQTFVIELINNKIEEINVAFAEFEGEIDDKIASVDTKISELETFVNAEISTLVTYVNDSVQQIINSSIEVQDPVVAGILSDPESETSQELSTLFTPLPAPSRNPLTGWVHMDGAGVSAENTPMDNATAIQAVLDSAGHGATLYFGDVFARQIIRVATNEITVWADEVTFIGAYAKSVYNPKIKGVGAGTLLTVTGNSFIMQGLNLSGDGEVSSGTFTATVDGILYDRSGEGSAIHYANLDSKIKDCCFAWFRQCVTAVGRNINFIENLFSSSLRGIRFARFPGLDGYGLQVNNNRFHSMGITPNTDLDGEESYCIENVDGTFSNQINNNYIDYCRNFFRGGMAGTQINNNVFVNASGIAIDILPTAGSWAINNNRFSGTPSGVITETQFNNLDSTPDHFIRCESSLQNGTIVGNSIMNTRYHAISLTSGSVMTIVGNLIVNPGLFAYLTDGVVSDGINIQDGNSSIIMGNRIRSTLLGGVPNMRYGINVGSGSNHRIDGNIATGFDLEQFHYTNQSVRVDDETYQQFTPRSAAGVPLNSMYVNLSDGALMYRDESGTSHKVAFS